MVSSSSRRRSSTWSGSAEGRTGQALDSMICSGVVISGGTVRRSVLCPGVHVHSYAEIESSVLFAAWT